MAVTTTTTLTELVNSELINRAVLAYAVDYTVAAPYMHVMDLRGQATNVGSFPQWVLDTATDLASETTTLANEALETTDTQITGLEIGLRRDITDAAVEMTTLGAGLFQYLVKDAATLFAVSLDDDIVALFTSIASNVGTTTVNLTLANMVEAQAQIRINGKRGQLVYVLDDQQASDLQVAQQASTSSTTNSFFEVSTGIESGYLGTFMGAPVHQTGLCDSANAGADQVGCCFINGQTDPENAAFGMVMARGMRTEEQRDANERLTEVVFTAKWGVGEIADLSACAITTDA